MYCIFERKHFMSVFFVLILYGMGIFNEIGIWLYVNSQMFVFALIIVSILNAEFIVSKCRKKWYSGVLYREKGRVYRW